MCEQPTGLQNCLESKKDGINNVMSFRFNIDTGAWWLWLYMSCMNKPLGCIALVIKVTKFSIAKTL